MITSIRFTNKPGHVKLWSILNKLSRTSTHKTFTLIFLHKLGTYQYLTSLFRYSDYLRLNPHHSFCFTLTRFTAIYHTSESGIVTLTKSYPQKISHLFVAHISSNICTWEMGFSELVTLNICPSLPKKWHSSLQYITLKMCTKCSSRKMSDKPLFDLNLSSFQNDKPAK